MSWNDRVKVHPQIDVLKLYFWATRSEENFWSLGCKARFLNEERKLGFFLYEELSPQVYNSNEYYSIPSSLMFLSYTSELQEASGRQNIKPGGGGYLTMFL